MENKECKNCKWNEYPICKGTIIRDGNFMNIENLRPDFRCGVKNRGKVYELPLIPQKSKLELLEEKILELEKKIEKLEK